jgi:hypothetical protein
VSTFTARYSSRCADCDEQIHPGDTVTFGGTSTIHADCDDAQTETEKALTVCPGCQLTQPCGCEDDR